VTLCQTLRQYLDDSGESMRALSLRAGLNPKTVSDILNIAGLQPRHSTLTALAEATGQDLFSCSATPRKTYADLITTAQKDGDSGGVSKLKWLCKQARWVPELQYVCKQDVIDFFDKHNAASFDLSQGSLATYRSNLVRIISGSQSRNRGRRIDDIDGLYSKVHSAIKGSDLPKNQALISGSFLLFLNDNFISPSDVTTETLAEYYNHRVKVSSKSAARCEKHVREIASLLKRLARHPAFASFGFEAVEHPFTCGRDKFRVEVSKLAPLLAEFDTRVGPWAQGLVSRDGLSRDAFIAELDEAENISPVSDKKARLRCSRKAKSMRPGQDTNSEAPSRIERLSQAGFLVGKGKWGNKTLACRRGYVVSLAKAIAATTDVVPETIEELTDPEFLEVAAETLSDINKGEYPSGYLKSVLKAVRKIARDFQCRTVDDLKVINDLISYYGVEHRGVAPRNKAKLQKFNNQCIQDTIDLSSMILSSVNGEIDKKRKAWRKKHGILPKPSKVLDAELGRDIMAALAHDILLARAPRSDNVLRARLDWIAWQGDCARILVPASQLKMRSAGDADLTIHLGKSTCKLLRTYLDIVRPALLTEDQKMNPYLFPGQGRHNRSEHFGALLKRVTRLLHHKVGVSIHPHLYRHLIGWIWLRDSLDNLPKVQTLLGHKNLQTTIQYYVDLDESLISEKWLKHLDSRSAASNLIERR